MSQFASVPTIWDLPPGAVMELQCQVRGADCCRYEFTWHEPVRGWRMGAGLLAGVAVGTGMGLLGLGPLPVLVPAIALGAASFGRVAGRAPGGAAQGRVPGRAERGPACSRCAIWSGATTRSSAATWPWRIASPSAPGS